MTLTNFILISLAVVGLFWVSNFAKHKKRYLTKNGVPACATVVNISKTGSEIGTSYTSARPVMNIVLTFEWEGISKRVVINQDLNTREIPKVGDKINIRVHPQDYNKVLIVEPISCQNNIFDPHQKHSSD
jgi:hypothetical protein